MKKITLILAIITILVSCETPNKEKPQIIKTADQIQNEIDRREYIDSTMAAMKIEAAKRVNQGNTWEYRKETNPMGEEQKFYSVSSTDLVYLDFPYEGGSSGTITIRKKNGRIDAIMFLISQGQIHTEYEGNYFRIKFDEEKPVNWSMSESATGSSDIMFFDNESALLNKIKKSKKVTLEVPFYNNGNQHFVFNTQNLKI
jgi:hypothetical protein